jgi:hypothetical protein
MALGTNSRDKWTCEVVKINHGHSVKRHNILKEGQ